MDFPFHRIYSLIDYNSVDAPVVFFGAYRFEDNVLIYNHKVDATIFWTGQDALDNHIMAMSNARNVTAHPKIHELITSKGFTCELVRPSTFLNDIRPQRLGPKIYAYCPSSAQDYHGIKIIEELRRGGYEITIGDGQFSQQEWRDGRADFFYEDVCIGLCLSEFAGGGTSIIEMGLRGIKVVTNVFDLPNTIKWHTIDDIVTVIEAQRTKIGSKNIQLSHDVWKSLDHEHKWLEV